MMLKAFKTIMTEHDFKTKQVPSVDFIIEFHQIIKREEINVIGATHYSTEKYACIAMISYFEKLGLPAEFLEGKYFLEDL